MINKLMATVFAAGFAAAVSMPSAANVTELAKGYAKLFEPLQGAKTGKHFHHMTIETFVNKVKAGEPIIGLDTRTPTEAAIVTTTLPGSLTIPINELFKAENLDRLPTDKTIFVVCQSGTRAIAVVTALHHIGFDNVYNLKGGLKALSNRLTAKTVNTMPLRPKQAAR